jgi:hypothetical protein
LDRTDGEEKDQERETKKKKGYSTEQELEEIKRKREIIRTDHTSLPNTDVNVLGFQKQSSEPSKYTEQQIKRRVFFFSLRNWVTQIHLITHISRNGYVSDTDAGTIRVRYTPDTPADVSEYPDNSDTPLIRR